MARCPAHDDRHASLSVGTGDDGRALVTCHAGCSVDDVARAMGLTTHDLFAPDDRPDRPRTWNPEPQRQATTANRKPTWPTLDAAIEAQAATLGAVTGRWTYSGGAVPCAVARFETEAGKSFRPFHDDGHGWRMGDPPGKTWPLYRGDELPSDGPVIVVEGEKCAESARTIGLAAVTSAHGAKSAHKSDWTALAGRDVLILPDADDAGREYAADVAAILAELDPPAKVRIVDLPDLDAGEDIADWIAADGPRADRTPEQLREEIAHLAAQADAATPGGLPAFVDVADLAAQDLEQAEPIIDGLLRRGEAATIVSSSKARKSWTVLGLFVALATGGYWLGRRCILGRALLIDCELQPATLRERLLSVLAAASVDPESIRGRLAVANWRGCLVTLDALARFLATIEPGQFDLVVFDPFYRMYPPGHDENDNAATADLYGRVIALAESHQVAVVLVCHSPKGDTSARSAIDLVAGAGSAGRAVDVAIALRAHAADRPDEPAIVLETVARSFPPLSPKAFRWDHPQWIEAHDLDPAELKRPYAKRPKRQDAQADRPKPPPWTSERFAAEVLTDEPRPKALIVDDAVTAGVKNAHRAGVMLERAEAEGLAHRWKLDADRRTYYAKRPQPKLTDEA